MMRTFLSESVFNLKMKEAFILEKDRIPVFIGKEGLEKKKLEEKFNVKIDVDSKTGDVSVLGEDSYSLFIVRNVIDAINFGHNPENAIKLEEESYVLDYIDLKSRVRDQKRLKIVLGRVIGKNGTTRKLIEEITKCSVSVKDNFVSFIGPYENTLLVHEALEMLIDGGSHKSFYAYLERNRVKMDTGLL